MRLKIIYTSIILAQLSACTSMAPTYHRPDNLIPAALPQQTAASTAVVLASWQDFVLDDRLRKVIQIALDNNQDLKKPLPVLNLPARNTVFSVPISYQP